MIIKSQVLRFRQNILFHDNWRCFKGRDKVLLANSMFTKYHWRHFQGGNAQKDWQRGQEKLSYKIGQVLLFDQDWDTTGPHHPRAGRCPGPPWCPARSSAATGGPWWPEERVHLVKGDSVNKEFKHNWTHGYLWGHKGGHGNKLKVGVSNQLPGEMFILVTWFQRTILFSLPGKPQEWLLKVVVRLCTDVIILK